MVIVTTIATFLADREFLGLLLLIYSFRSGLLFKINVAYYTHVKMVVRCIIV